MNLKFNGKNSNAYNKIDKKYEFRFNVITSNYEFRKRKKAKWKEYDDRDKSALLMELAAQGIEIATEKFNIFIESHYCSPDYNPFKVYFKELKPWDKKTDYIKKICNTAKAEKTKEFEDAVKRFFVGTIDCLLNADQVNDVCLVFQSPQGIGKSRWMRSLLPKEFQAKYLYEGAIDTRNKDHTMYLSQYWFIHLDELETLRNNDIAAIKSYITRQRISLRKAYGRYKSNLVRRASFLGSVNEDKFLSDLTGNRRWLVFKVGKVNYQHKINPDDFWAQAYYYYKKNFKYWFDVDEIKKINARNEAFRTKNTEEELFLKMFVCSKKKNKRSEYLTSSDICQNIMEVMPQFANKISTMRMGRVLAKHAKLQRFKNGLQEYYCEFVPPESKNKSTPIHNNDIGEEDDLPF